MNPIQITLASLASLCLLAPGVIAQGQRPDGAGAKPKIERGQERPKKERPEAKRPDTEEAPRTRPEAKPAVDHGREVVAARRAEANHRKRLAKLRRLRQIAIEANDTAKIERIDKAGAKENARYERVLAGRKERMGAERYDALMESVSKGRRAQGKRPKAEKSPKVEKPSERPTKRPKSRR